MSSSTTSPSNTKKPVSSADSTQHNASPSSKGKAKARDPNAEEEEEEEDEEDEDMGSEEEASDDEEVEDNFEEIDPSVIKGRRTRGVRVDYTSKEALAKAGLQGKDEDEDEEDEDVHMKD